MMPARWLLAWGAPALLAASAVAAQTVTSARYADPTTRYAHGVLGDAIEHGTLELALAGGEVRRFVLPTERVFEDTAPRVQDLDGDGSPEVIVVESDRSRGARLAVYDAAGLVTATPYIGQSHRWLAPLGAADLDGDGTVEIAYVDRPHLARILRIWRYEDQRLTQVAQMPGVTNHRIGERDIAGGIRLCSGQPEVILASADWSRVMAVRFDGTSLRSEDAGPHRNRQSFARALQCD